MDRCRSGQIVDNHEVSSGHKFLTMSHSTFLTCLSCCIQQLHLFIMLHTTTLTFYHVAYKFIQQLLLVYLVAYTTLTCYHSVYNISEVVYACCIQTTVTLYLVIMSFDGVMSALNWFAVAFTFIKFYLTVSRLKYMWDRVNRHELQKTSTVLLNPRYCL